MLTSLITIISLSLYSTNAGDQNRTCACAQFAEGNCVRQLTPAAEARVAADPDYVINDAEDYCAWSAVTDTKGNHGICRTPQWLECHYNNNCVHETSPSLSHRSLADDLSADRTANVINNWPWGCAEILDPLDTKDSEYQKAKERGGRTCACDGFLESDCITMDSPMPNSGKCQWHEVTDSLGTHGICRTQTWLDCHFGGDCSHNDRKQRKQKVNDYKNRQLLDGEYDIEADENINVEIDWPWECPEWTREKKRTQDVVLVNVMDDGNKSDIVQQSEGSIYGKLFGLIIFAVIIGIAVCYKFKSYNDKKMTLSENGGVSYSTFERV